MVTSSRLLDTCVWSLGERSGQKLSPQQVDGIESRGKELGHPGREGGYRLLCIAVAAGL